METGWYIPRQRKKSLLYCSINYGDGMKTHRVNELIELLHPEWQKDPDFNLLAFLKKLAEEAKYTSPLEDLTDDVLIYHLKMRNSEKDAMIPGLAKDCENDFKTALLRARGIIR